VIEFANVFRTRRRTCGFAVGAWRVAAAFAATVCRSVSTVFVETGIGAAAVHPPVEEARIEARRWTAGNASSSARSGWSIRGLPLETDINRHADKNAQDRQRRFGRRWKKARRRMHVPLAR